MPFVSDFSEKIRIETAEKQTSVIISVRLDFFFFFYPRARSIPTNTAAGIVITSILVL